MLRSGNNSGNEYWVFRSNQWPRLVLHSTVTSQWSYDEFCYWSHFTDAKTEPYQGEWPAPSGTVTKRQPWDLRAQPLCCYLSHPHPFSMPGLVGRLCRHLSVFISQWPLGWVLHRCHLIGGGTGAQRGSVICPSHAASWWWARHWNNWMSDWEPFLCIGLQLHAGGRLWGGNILTIKGANQLRS